MKILHGDSYSSLSITLSCKVFQYNLSKDFIACRSFSNCFLYLTYFFMILLCNTLLPNDKAHAISADSGKRSKPTAVIDRVTVVDVAPLLAIVSFDSAIMFTRMKFFFVLV